MRFVMSSLPLLLLSLVTRADTPSIQDLVAPPVVTSVKISPGGDYLCIQVFHEGKHSLRFVDTASGTILGGFRVGLAGNRSETGPHWWVNHERVVGMVYERPPSQEQPRYYGELFGTNYDGTKTELLFGYRTGVQVGTKRKRKTADLAWADIIDVLPADPEHILISRKPMTQAQDKPPVAKLLNVYTGVVSRRTLAEATYANATFYADEKGKIRLIVSTDQEETRHVQARFNDDEGWINLDPEHFGRRFTPVSIAGVDNAFYVVDDYQSDLLGLFRFSMDTRTMQKVYVPEVTDITDVLRSTDRTTIYAVRVDDGYPRYLLLATEHPERKIFRSLLHAFPGYIVDITSRTEDGRWWVLHTTSDVDPGSYYLFDQENHSLKLLFREKPHLKSDDLMPMEPVSFTSFDGKKIHGYYTRGKSNHPTKTPPMVVVIHGGPRARDYWGYDPVVQVYATRGYSVLQINYRGSSGYGEKFMNAGNRQWGDAVQNDIIAATRQAVDQGLAAAGNICIAGASFGAYSALQSAILAPDLYRCVIANAGIYNLELLSSNGDIHRYYGGDEYLDEAIGSDKDQLARYSPVHHVASLQAPVFIAHGKRDVRAPFKHARQLRKAMDKAGKPYEWFVRKREGHGFYDVTNEVEYLRRSLSFLDAHLDRPK